jgi:hypothetical protein
MRRRCVRRTIGMLTLRSRYGHVLHVRRQPEGDGTTGTPARLGKFRIRLLA